MARALLTKMAIACVGAALAAACSSEGGPFGASPGGGDGQKSDDVTGNGGGSGGGSGGGTPTTTGLPCDVDAVLKSRCQTCHASETKYGASAPLVTWDDLQKPGPGGSASKKVYQLLKERIHDEARPMPPTPNPRLTDKEAQTLDAWVAGGAKSSTDRCTNEKPDDAVKPLNCKPDATLKANKPFEMAPGSALDQYVCFGVEMQLTTKKHVTALAPRVDNTKILHHILLFQSPSAESPEPTPCAAFGSASWKLMGGWAPGGQNLELPAEAGYPLEKGTTHWVVQLHYNNALNLAGQKDNSGYDLCTTDKLRPNDAGVLAFGSTKFSIPPRSTSTVSCTYKLGNQFQNTKFFNASPHMHTRGTAMSTEKLAANGGSTMIFDQKNFNFENQANFPITATATSGDTLRTKCTWKNPGDTAIGFGEGTGDEMCFDFLSYYPNIPDRTIFGLPLFTWVTPSSSASCTME